MALRAKWTVRIDNLKTRLRIGALQDSQQSEALSVRLEINGLAADAPQELADCFDYAPICDWITREWPRTDAVSLLENRVNELLGFLFQFDRRVHEAGVGLYKTGRARGSTRVGVERRATRAQFQTGRREPRSQ